MVTTLDIAWVAGIVEGEGSVGIRNGCPNIQVQMTDRDVIERLCGIIGVKPRTPWRRGRYKPVYGCVLSGIKAIQWMMTLYVLMGERRKAKIAEVIETWKASSAAPRASRGTRLPAVCHPARPRTGGMLCKTCYMREWRKRTGRNTAHYRQAAA